MRQQPLGKLELDEFEEETDKIIEQDRIRDEEEVARRSALRWNCFLRYFCEER